MFFDRFKALCDEKGVSPTRATQEAGISKGSLAYWKARYKQGIDANPGSESARALANYFGVSVDYLLERTDDPTDYSRPDLIAGISKPVLDHFDGDVRRAINFERAVQNDAQMETAKVSGQVPKILTLYQQLDDMDKARVEAYITGLLAADKYQSATREA